LLLIAATVVSCQGILTANRVRRERQELNQS